MRKMNDTRETYKIDEKLESTLKVPAVRTKEMQMQRCVNMYNELDFFEVDELASCAVVIEIIQNASKKGMSIKSLLYLLRAYANDSIYSN